MVATVTQNSKEDAIDDYKNALGKKLNGNEIVVVPAKWPGMIDTLIEVLVLRVSNYCVQFIVVK